MTPLKAEYIGADQLPFFVFRLQLCGGPYIPIRGASSTGRRKRRSSRAGAGNFKSFCLPVVSQFGFLQGKPCTPDGPIPNLGVPTRDMNYSTGSETVDAGVATVFWFASFVSFGFSLKCTTGSMYGGYPIFVVSPYRNSRKNGQE